METIIDQSLCDIFFRNEFLKFSAVDDELVSTSSVLSSEENLVGTIKLVGHVVGVQDGLLRGL